MAAILIVGILMILICNIFLPNIFYSFLKPYMLNNISLAAEHTATKISYILHQNTQYHLRFYKNEDLIKLVNQYENSNEIEKQELGKTIGNYFPVLVWGENEAGSIQYQQDMGLIINGKEGFAKEEIQEEIDLVLRSEWYKAYCSEIGNKELFADTKYPRFYSPAFKLEKDGATYEFLAYCLRWSDGVRSYDTVMIQDIKNIKKIMREFQELHSSDIAMLDVNQELLYADQENSYFKEITKDYPKKIFEGKQYELRKYEKNNTIDIAILVSYNVEGLKLAIHMTTAEMISPWKHIILVVQILFLIFTFLILLIVSFILSKNLKNLKRLTYQMKQVQQGNYKEITEIETNDEVGRLSQTFCKMIREIGQYIQDIIHHEESEKQIQYSLLVSQIDPHFIYNTLNTITYLAKLNRVDDIMKLNGALIITLKDRLKMKQYKTFDTIENEKVVLDQYILIQNYLCTNRIQFTFTYDKQYRELEIPKNVLQPFVENSILHGLLLHRDSCGNLLDGEIEIRIEKEESGLRVFVSDNGIGMGLKDIEKYFIKEPDMNLSKTSQESHIGIYNIRMRLNYLYHGDYKSIAYRNDFGGLTIELYLPDRVVQNNNKQVV